MKTHEPVLLLIRGTLTTTDVDAARELHNATAGNDAGVAAARALGDLSHKVYLPLGGKPGELLIMDVWKSPEGIQKFFADPHVQAGGAKLFAERDPVVFMPAEGSYGFNLPAPMKFTERYVGIIRAKAKSPQLAMDTFRQVVGDQVSLARQRGQLSHALYFRMAPPEADGSVELLGVDVWADKAGMNQHYEEHTAGLGKCFVGAPTSSIWTAPPGMWVEW